MMTTFGSQFKRPLTWVPCFFKSHHRSHYYWGTDISTPDNSLRTIHPGQFPSQKGQFPLPYCSKPNLKTTYIHTCMHTCIHIYIHAYTHRCMHTHIYAYNTYIYVYIHTYIHSILAYIHTDVYVCMLVYVCMYMYACICMHVYVCM